MDKHTIQSFKKAIETEPLSKSWSMRFGDDIVPLFGCGSAFYITHYFRKVFKIRPYAPWTCYAPVLATAGLTIDLFNEKLTNNVIMSGESCLPCTCMKSGLLQVALAIGFPLVLAPIISLQTADRLVTYPVPPLLRAPKEVLTLIQRLIQKKSRAFIIAGVIQFTGAALVTWHKHVCVNTFLEE